MSPIRVRTRCARLFLQTLALVLACFFATAASLSAGITANGVNSTTALAYSAAASSTDLINNGGPTLATAVVTPSYAGFPGGGINDGGYSNTGTNNTYFQIDTHFPATATYTLNLASAPNGYDLTSIDSFMGWSTVAQAQANQDYTVEVRTVGSAGFRPLAYVKYTPFSGSGGSYETRVTVTDTTTGVLATNVEAIRFIFADPGNNGTVIREIDVQGGASATAPTAVTVQSVTDFSETDNAYAGEVLANDLGNSGQSTLVSFSSSTVPAFGAGGQNNGTYNLASTTGAAWYRGGQTPAQLPATLTFELNTGSAPDGYAISAIRTFAGWKGGGSQTLANQKYSIEYRSVGSGTWSPLETVDYSPFSTLSNTPANTRVVVSAPTGHLVSNVAALRFNFQAPSRSGGANNGTLLQEIDIVGFAVDVPMVTINGLAERSIFQRNSSNTGTIPISGSYTLTPDRIEARAVLMAGATAGATTDWQTIQASPSGGAFSGNFTNVPAGGWYQIEVRSMTGATPLASATRSKIGVGDIFITAGQSNAANHGAPVQSAASDLINIFNLNSSSWQVANDPQPYATGSGGSPWPAFGDRLTARTQLPVGIVSVAVGGTEVSQWVPNSGTLYPRINLAINSLQSYGGFRAILWHQGESDTLAGTTAANYATRLNAVISQSRTDAGFAVPWGVALVSYHPSGTAANMAQVIAGQQQVIGNTAGVFKGAETDDFGSRGWLSDGVHFNAAGLQDHGRQWAETVDGAVLTASNDAPLFNPPGGGYPEAVLVTITGEAGSTIYYTTDGTTPTTSSPSGPSPMSGISIPSNSTSMLRAFATLPGSPDSPVANATYVTVPTMVWTNPAGGSWPVAGNWLNNLPAGGSGITADFSTLTMPSNLTVTLNGARTVGHLLFDDQNSTKHSWTVNAGTGGPLTLASGSGVPSISCNVPTTIAAVLAGNQGLTKNGTGTLTLGAAESFSGTTVINNGTLMLGTGGGVKTISGDIVVNAGATLAFSNYNQLGAVYSSSAATNTVTLNNGGTLAWTNTVQSFQNLTLDNVTLGLTGGFDVQWGTLNIHGTLTALGNSAITAASGNFNTLSPGANAGNRTLTVSTPGSNDALTIGVPVTDYSGGVGNGYYALAKTGPGRLTLPAASTYSGATSINAGTLQVTNTTGSATGTGNVIVESGGTLGGTGLVGGTVAVAGTLAPGTTGTGTLTTGAVTLSGSYACQVDGANCDKLVVNGSLTLTGATLAISTVTTPTASSYVIATYTGSTPIFTTVTGLPSGYVVDTTTSGQIKLVLSPYHSWAASEGLTEANDGKAEDADGDRNSNVMEYAFGTDPLSGATGALVYADGVLNSRGQPTTDITPLENGAEYRAVFCRRKDYVAAGLIYTVQFSVDLSEWVDGTDTPIVVASDSEIDAVSVPYPSLIPTVNGMAQPTFFRVSISENP